MGLFDFWKKKKVLDFTNNPGSGEFSDEDENMKKNEGESASFNASAEEKKKKFAKRISDLIERIDDMSIQIYHLQQRVEVLEKKANVSNGRE